MRKKYDNIGTELWFEDAKAAILTAGGASIEKADHELLAHQLATRQYDFTVGREQKLRLVSKKVMKARGLGSPDRADAWVLAFADMRKLGITSALRTIRIS
jgi:hypothetical protein